jgi:hypothetical protein
MILPPQKFVQQPYCFTGDVDFRNHDCRFDSNSKSFIPGTVNIP